MNRGVAISLALAILAAPAAQAQVLAPQFPPGVMLGRGALDGAAAPAYTGPGDIVSGWTAFYSLRAFTAAIAATGTQTLVNLRNTATSEQCDVIVATSGGMDHVANCTGSSTGDSVATFCAEDSGSCAVTEWYDQTGNGWNVVQTTTTYQPALAASCLGSFYCLSENTSLQILEAASNFTPATGVTSLYAVGYRATGGTAQDTFIAPNGSASPNMVLSAYSTANEWRLSRAFGGNITVTAADGAWHIGIGVINGSSSKLDLDGTTTSGTVTGNTAAGKPIAISDAESVTFNMVEGGFLDNVALSSTQLSNLCHNAYEYWGTGTSC